MAQKVSLGNKHVIFINMFLHFINLKMQLLLYRRNEIIICLSEIVREDVLREGDMRVEKECRQQLNVEVLRRVSET